MKMIKNPFLHLLILLAIFISACKKKTKDEDMIYPAITITKPGYGITYNMFDTIQVQVKVSDNNTLTKVTVGLTDMNKNAVQDAVVFTPNSTPLDINISYPISNFHISSGFYYMMIYASDGQNEIQSARTIYIKTSPTVKMGYYIFTSGSNQHTLQKLDTNYASLGIVKNTGIYNGSVIANYNHRLYLNGAVNRDFQAYDSGNNMVKWIKQNSGSGAPYFSYCDTDKKNAFIGYYNGQLIKYDSDGNQLTSYSYPNSDYFPQYGSSAASKYLAQYQSKTNSLSKKLIVYDLNSGAALKELTINFTAVSVFEKSFDEVYILGNDNNNQGVLYVYTVSTGSLKSATSLNSGKIICACMMDSNTLLFSMDDGNTYQYQFDVNNFSSIIEGELLTQIKYDEFEKFVYYSSNVQLKICTLNNFKLSTIKTYNHSDTIRDFQIIYNK